MKKRIKKSLFLISISSLIIGASFGSSLLISSFSKSNNNNPLNSQLARGSIINNPISFNGKNYPNIYAAIEDYINIENNVIQKSYVGTPKILENDLIDISNMREYDSSKLSHAYKTSSDKYTSSIEYAKKSYLREPYIMWTDNKGNLFDSDRLAQEFINNDIETTPISYYEITDHSEVDVNKKPILRKINPLNKNDLNSLKKYAINNMFLDKSNFKLERFIDDNQTYKSVEFIGKSYEEINSIIDSILFDMTNIIKKELWFNVDLSVKFDPKREFLANSEETAGNSVIKKHYIEYKIKHKNSSPKSVRATYDQIISDMELFDRNFVFNYFDDKTVWQEYENYYPLFDRIYNSPSPAAHNMLGFYIRQLDSKKNKSIFGHKDITIYPTTKSYGTIRESIHYRDGQVVKNIGFQGSSPIANTYFGARINQDNLKMDSKYLDPVAKKERTTKVIKEIQQLFNSKLVDELNVDKSMVNRFLELIWKQLPTIMENKIIYGNEILIDYGKDASVFMNKFQNELSKLIYRKLVNSSTTLSKIKSSLFDAISNEHWTNEKIDDNGVIYLITYNGHPLFKMSNEIFKGLYIDDKFKTNPLDTIKKYLYNKLANDYSNTMKLLTDNLVNVSNSFVSNKDGNAHKLNYSLSRSSIDNYEKVNQINTFNYQTKNIVNSAFDKKYNELFIDESLFTNIGITPDKFSSNLLSLDSDDQANLYTGNGTYQAIYYYNLALEKRLSEPHPNNGQIKQLDANAVTNLNDIVNLFEKDGSPKQIKYGEYFDNNFRFNSSLTLENVALVHTKESKNRIISTNKSNKPTQVYIVTDLNGNDLSSIDIANGVVVNDGYATSANQAIENAMNKINITNDISKIYYNETDQNGNIIGEPILLDNNVYKLYVLNYSNKQFAFKKYSELYDYLFLQIQKDSQKTDQSLYVDPIYIDQIFSNDAIDFKKIKSKLVGFNQDEINNMSNEQMYEFFGDAFKNINSLNQWMMYINNLKFNEKSNYSNDSKNEWIMNINLNNGYYVSNNLNSLSVDLSSSSLLNDSKSKLSSFSIVIISITTIIAIVLIAISISLVVGNRKKDNKRDLSSVIKK